MRPRAILATVVLLTTAGSSANCGGRSPDSTPIRAADSVATAFETRRSGFMITVPGKVVRILPDDEQGVRHQRFIILIRDSQTLLVSHNIDVARRAPVAVGDSVTVRGQYEWNREGGVIHWTHRDPGRARAGGWIRHRGIVHR